MDIFSHFLWVSAIFKIVNLNLNKAKRKFNLIWAGLWGIFPDLFAFTIPFIFIIYNLIFNASSDASTMHTLFTSSGAISNLTDILYSISHSLVIFIVVFVLLYLIFKKPFWILSGWLIHILIDIPLHDNGRWATPFLWPVSSYTFNGIAWWKNSWIDFVNYSLLILVWICLLWYDRKSKK